MCLIVHVKDSVCRCNGGLCSCTRLIGAAGDVAVRQPALRIATVSEVVSAEKTAGVAKDALQVRSALELLSACPWGVMVVLRPYLVGEPSRWVFPISGLCLSFAFAAHSVCVWRFVRNTMRRTNQTLQGDGRLSSTESQMLLSFRVGDSANYVPAPHS